MSIDPDAQEPGTVLYQKDLCSDEVVLKFHQQADGYPMKVIASLLIYFLVTSSAMAQSVKPGSRWINAGGSVLEISTVSATGELTGTYTNNVKGIGCKGQAIALKGWLNGDLITFTVRWKNAQVDCNSITTWTGYHAAGKIFTDWDLIFISATTGLPTHMRNTNVFTPN